MSDPTTINTEPADRSPVSAPPPPRCRSLTVRGLQCRSRALRGHNLCVQHAKYRFPVCPTGSHVAIPLLEDLDTVQVVATQVAQGLFANTLDPDRAGKILYACQIAAFTLPRPANFKPADKRPTPLEPASEIFPAVDGSFLGPALAWSADHAGARWSFEKFLYAQECERQGKPIPATVDDFPVSGWLNPEEAAQCHEDPKQFWDGFRERIFRLRIEADQRGELPPLPERSHCAYGNDFICLGPAGPGPRGHRPCEFCHREREEFLRLPPREQPAATPEPESIGDLQAVGSPAEVPSPLSLDELLDLPRRNTSARSTPSRYTGQCPPCRSRQQQNETPFQQLAVSPTRGEGGRSLCAPRRPKRTPRVPIKTFVELSGLPALPADPVFHGLW